MKSASSRGRDAAALAANRAHLHERAQAQVEGGDVCSGGRCPPPPHVQPHSDVNWRLVHWRELPTLRPSEVAMLTGLSRSEVYRLVGEGTLTRVPGLRAVLIRTASLADWLGEDRPARRASDQEIEREAEFVLKRLRR